MLYEPVSISGLFFLKLDFFVLSLLFLFTSFSPPVLVSMVDFCSWPTAMWIKLLQTTEFIILNAQNTSEIHHEFGHGQHQEQQKDPTKLALHGFHSLVTTVSCYPESSPLLSEALNISAVSCRFWVSVSVCDLLWQRNWQRRREEALWRGGEGAVHWVNHQLHAHHLNFISSSASTAHVYVYLDIISGA